ncbi:HAD-IIIC family phosphatase [Streptomyces sp. NPDC057307]|uniref:HAD-IIIC family phosphatase n=1 Tax=Streptomyces sp. NPDC057307 TaxID=3346096 RepID=UPI003625A59D
MSSSRPLSATADDALDELRALHKEGRLAERYPLVRGLLTGLTEAQLVTAGRLLARLDADEVRRPHPSVPVVNVAVTGHGTVGDLVPALTAQLARAGLLLRARVSDFDAYVFDLSDPNSGLYAHAPDLTLCLLDQRIVLDELPVPWRPADLERVLAEKVALLERLVVRYGATASGTLVLNTLPLLGSVTAQLVDHASRAEVSALWHEANARLLRLTAEHPHLTVLDVAPWLAAGVPATDARLSVYAKAHLSSGLLAAYAKEAGHLVRHLTGRAKKVLAVDLDETVWGGILGDAGIDGIEVADTYRGEAFNGFQRVLKQLSSQGVLLTAVSKNDQDAVREVLSSHPRMALREDDFVRVVANWDPKHGNIEQLAADLNLGVDSFVFVDDSPFECGLVRHELPEVAVVPLDTEPALHIEKLLRDGWFDVRNLTAEDRVRPGRYRDELVRNDFLDSFDSLDDYLANLGVTVQLRETEPRDVPRVSQMTLRTNQFNLTTVRLQEPEVRELAADPASRVLAIASADRFGDNGLVGAVFTRQEGTTTYIDNFLLSCRVFSRGIERSCLAVVLEQAKADGATEVIASYRRSAKNGKVAAFYPQAGFAAVTDDGATVTFRHTLDTLPGPAPHVRLSFQFNGSKGIPSEQLG